MRRDGDPDRRWMMSAKSGRRAAQGKLLRRKKTDGKQDRQKSDAYYGVMRI